MDPGAAGWLDAGLLELGATGVDADATCAVAAGALAFGVDNVWNWAHPKYKAEAMNAAAAIPKKIFLFPLPVLGSTFAPPKVNEGSGAGAESAIGSLMTAASGLSMTTSANAFDAGLGATGACGAVRVNAGAAAAAPLVTAENGGATDGLGGATRTGVALNDGAADTVIDGVDTGGAGTGCCARVSTGALSFGAGVALATAADGHAGAVVGLAIGTSVGRADVACGITGTCGFAGETGFGAMGLAACVAGVDDGVVAARAAPMVGSLLRKRPRATRSVPLVCSILMGLVRTRLAPMRNAFATPA